MKIIQTPSCYPFVLVGDDDEEKRNTLDRVGEAKILNDLLRKTIPMSVYQELYKMMREEVK